MSEQSAYTTDCAALAHHLGIRLQTALGTQSWLAQTEHGLDVVLKCGPGAGADVQDFLVKCRSLHPSFDYPRIISAEPGFYLVYQFIPGESLHRLEFESEEVISAVFQLSGRVTALFRSLKLTPMIKGLKSRPANEHDSQELKNRCLAALGFGLNQQLDGLAVRRSEASQSYAWAQNILTSCYSRWPGIDNPHMVPWETLRKRIETVTSIHLTVQGSNLAHTRFTPEHILRTGKNQWGLVGWQVAPRPYNYMRYKYLAWCLIHSRQQHVENYYRNVLQMMPSIHAAAANSLTFALCLLESWVETTSAVDRRAKKLQTVLTFVEEALAVSANIKASETETILL